jgi:hypothetical protein
MESRGYELRDRSLVGTLAGLTFAILQCSAERDDGGAVTAHRPFGTGLLDRLDTWFWEQQVRSREAFLAQSVDVVDLEYRLRWLERAQR